MSDVGCQSVKALAVAFDLVPPGIAKAFRVTSTAVSFSASAGSPPAMPEPSGSLMR